MTILQRPVLLCLLLAACGSSGSTVGATDAQVTDARGTDAQVQGTDAQAQGTDAGSDPCSTPSPCPNDPRLSPEDIMNCRTSLEAQRGQPCAAENNAVNDCRARNIACGTDGMNDFTATSERFNMACMTLVMAREACCASPAGMGSPNCI